MLFAEGSSTIAKHPGFSDWKNGERNISRHENSTKHRQSITTLFIRRKDNSRVDSAIQKEYSQERHYWINVLLRAVSAIKFLAERGLAFRGSDEIIGSSHNCNYIGILELISEFDPFLSSHIQKYANRGRGHTSYLSSTCNNL